jgi:hypothetical protein
VELELKKAYLEQEGQNTDEISQQITRTRASRNELRNKLKNAEIMFLMLNSSKISDLQSKLSNFSLEEQAKALKSREGEAFEILKERSQYFKRNTENRENIAKLLIMLSTVKDMETRDRLGEVLEIGKISESVPVEGCDGETIKVIVILFNRLDIPCSISEDGKHVLAGKGGEQEKMFLISDRKIWVAPDIAEKLSENLSNIDEISPKLQWKNAQRQIKTLSDEEEKEFADLQRKYLDLLKEQDELLKGTNDEEKFVIEVS